jgi:hypothetical protein
MRGIDIDNLYKSVVSVKIGGSNLYLTGRNDDQRLDLKPAPPGGMI